MANIFGVNGHPVTQPEYAEGVLPWQRQMDLLKELKAGWYRVDFFVAGDVPVLPEADYIRFKKLFDIAKLNNIQILPVIGVTGLNVELTPESECYLKSKNAGIAFASAFDCPVYDLDNESNIFPTLRTGESYISPETGLPTVYPFGPPDGNEKWHFETQRYNRWRGKLKGLRDGVKQARPACRSMFSGSWRAYGFYNRLIEDKVICDIIGWHWYYDNLYLDTPQGQPAAQTLINIKKLAPELWITEINKQHGCAKPSTAPGNIGGYIEDQALQEVYMREHMARYLADPDIQALFIYELLDQRNIPWTVSTEGAFGCYRLNNLAQPIAKDYVETRGGFVV